MEYSTKSYLGRRIDFKIWVGMFDDVEGMRYRLNAEMQDEKAVASASGI